MITCQACGHANTDDSTFCTECSKALKVKDDIGTINTPNPNDPVRRDPAKPMPELAPGTVFDNRYTIVEKIGQGGMGSVYRATEQLGSITRDIALKLIRADLLADSQAVDRLMHEGVLTQGIRHDNIVTVYNVGVAQDAPYVAMEYVDGVSLRDWIRRQRYADTQKDPPPMAVVAALIRSILDGLNAAHLKGVIHRDLKPENVILLADPTPEGASLKILDFGIARAPGKVDALTGTGMGTPKYMAPEQETDPASANASSDLYSLSRMFYELLMGVPPSQWQPPSGGRGDVPQAIDALIQKGLGVQRTRPQSVAEYRDALDAALRTNKPDKPVRLFGEDGDQTEVVVKKGNNKLWYWLGGGALVLVGLANMPDDSDTTEGPGEVVIPADGPVGPGVQYRQPRLSDYSGDWIGDLGNSLDVSVDDAGTVSGSVSGEDYSFGVGGSIQNGALNFDFGNGQVASIPLAINPQDWCHPYLSMLDPNTGQSVSERFHVNHEVGDPCPALYAE